MMNRNMAIGVAVIALLVVGGLVYFVVPALLKPDNSMTVSFYNADDELIDSITTDPTVWDFSFVSDGSEVTKVVIDVGYDTLITGEPSLINVFCDLTWEVVMNTPTGSTVNGPETDRGPLKGTSSGEFTFTYQLADLITPIDSMGETYGWGIRFQATLTGTAEVDGELVHATPWTSGKVVSVITWDEAEASMTFVSTYIGESVNP